MKVELSCQLWLERRPDLGSLQAMRAGGTEQDIDLPGKSTGHIPVSSEATASFRWLRLCKWGCLEVGMCWNHIEWLYFLRRCFPLNTKLVNFLCKKSHHRCTLGRRFAGKNLFIYWRIYKASNWPLRILSELHAATKKEKATQVSGEKRHFIVSQVVWRPLGSLTSPRAELRSVAVIVVVGGYVRQQGQELSKVNLVVLILVFFIKDIGQVISASFLLWGKTTKQGNFSPTRVMSWEKRKRQRQRKEDPAQPKGTWCGIEEGRCGMRWGHWHRPAVQQRVRPQVWTWMGDSHGEQALPWVALISVLMGGLQPQATPSKPPTRLHLPKFCSRTQINSVVCSVCLTHYDSMNCSPPGPSVHGDSPGKNTGVGNLSLLQGNFWPRNQTGVSCITGRFFTSWGTREAPNKPYSCVNITKSLCGIPETSTIL